MFSGRTNCVRVSVGALQVGMERYLVEFVAKIYGIDIIAFKV